MDNTPPESASDDESEATLIGSGKAPAPPANLAAAPPAAQAEDDSPRVMDSTSVPVQGDLPGAPLAAEQPGRYAIKRTYGVGGQGVVYLAFDSCVGREVALKVLSARSAQAGSPVEARFLREARITGQLEHPSIVPVHEVGRRADGSVYYTQKLVRGRTLSEALRECKNLAERLKLLGHFVDVCQAVAYAHGRGVVHRDLKPANVMVGEFGVTVLLDWGLAKMLGHHEASVSTISGDPREIAPIRAQSGSQSSSDALPDTDTASTRDGAVLGTPLYMSPEQAAGRLNELDETTDTWALGVMLYELLAGTTPFAGGPTSAVLFKVQKGAFAPLAKVEPEAPPELCAVVRRALTLERAGRYQSARELAAEVEAFMLGGRVAAYEYSPWELVKKLVAKNPIAAAAGLLALVVFAAASLLLLRAHTKTVSALADALALHAAGALEEQRWPQAAAWFAAARAQEERSDARLGESIAEALAPLPTLRLVPHGKPAEATLFSPDGAHILSTAADGALRIWDAKSGALLARAPAHRGLAPALAVARDGTIATGGADGLVKLFSSSGAPIGQLRPSADETQEPSEGGADEGTEGAPAAGIAALDISPDGKLLAIASLEVGVELWDLRARTRVASIGERSDRVIALAFSPDGKRVALGDQAGVLRIFELAEGAPREWWRRQAHSGRLRALAWSPDGQRLATAGQDSLVQLWSPGSDGPPLRMELHQRAADGVRFSPDGAELASCSRDGLVVLWDANTGRVVARLDADERAANGVAFSPDGAQLAAAFQDEAVRVWAMPAQRGIVSLVGHTDGLRALSFSPSGAQLASIANDGMLRLWDVQKARASQVLETGTDKPRALAYAPDGKLLATGGDGDSLRLWDPQSGVLVRRLPVGEEGTGALSFTGTESAVRLLGVGGRRGTLQLWDPNSRGAARTIATGHPAIESLAFSPDGKLVATSGNDGFVRVWEVSTGERVVDLHAHGEACRGVSFSPDGRLLSSAGSDRRLILYSTNGWGMIREFSGHRGRVYSALFSPDGRWLASSSSDHSLRVFEVATGDLLFESARSQGALTDLSWSPDGRAIATASADKTIEVLRLGSGVVPAPGDALAQVLRSQWLRLKGLRIEPLAASERGRSAGH